MVFPFNLLKALELRMEPMSDTDDKVRCEAIWNHANVSLFLISEFILKSILIELKYYVFIPCV